MMENDDDGVGQTSLRVGSRTHLHTHAPAHTQGMEQQGLTPADRKVALTPSLRVIGGFLRVVATTFCAG